MHHLEYDVRKHARGVMNWWVEEEDGQKLLTITLNIQGVNYVYRQFFNDFEEVRMEVRSELTRERSVLGYLSAEELLPEQEEEVPSGALLISAADLQRIGLPANFMGRGA